MVSRGSLEPKKSLPLEAKGLSRAFGGTQVLQGLDLHLNAGELFGLVGPDGAGKTTAIRLMTGLLPADEGETWVYGEPVSAGGRAREAIGYMPQRYSLYGDLSIAENLIFFGQLFGLPKADLQERMARLLSITRLDKFADRRAENLSGGMYKKLALACALLHQPKVLLLDEPSNGVDPVSRRELWDLLYEFVEEGMAILLSTPDMEEAARCHRVGLLYGGKLLAEGNPRRLMEDFCHTTLLIRTEGRDAAEDALHQRPEVLALSPQGADLRVVVAQGGEKDFHKWLATASPCMTAERLRPNFEDVFLGILKQAPRGEAL